MPEYGLEIKTYSDDIYENQEQDPIGTYQVVQFSKEGSTGLLVGESTEKVFVIFGVRDNKNFIAQISKEDFDELIRLHIEHTGEL